MCCMLGHVNFEGTGFHGQDLNDWLSWTGLRGKHHLQCVLPEPTAAAWYKEVHDF